MPNAVIAHSKSGEFDLHGLKEEAREWPGLEGMDLAKDVTARQIWTLDEKRWEWNQGYKPLDDARFNVVVIDYGVKRNILRSLSSVGARVTVVPASGARRPRGSRRISTAASSLPTRAVRNCAAARKMVSPSGTTSSCPIRR